jgi:hypothetical protein
VALGLTLAFHPVQRWLASNVDRWHPQQRQLAIAVHGHCGLD